jgi:NADPH2:quinone reductase
MPKAIRLNETGGPDKLLWQDVEVGAPASGELQVRHTAVGLNYIDVYFRSGLYPMSLPNGLGFEAAGVVAAVGPKVRGFKSGDRVAYITSGNPGAYSQARNVSADRVVKVPAGITDDQAAVLMLKGLTAHYLLRRTYRVKKGDTILVHAAAGGVGLILVQWGRALGAKVIGVVGSEAKAAIARKAGCRHVLLQNDALAAQVKELTRGEGVNVVYDSVGKDTFVASLDCLRPLGLMVTYGNASGPVPPFSPLELSKRGSLFLTRPSLFAYIAKRADLETAARETFAAVKKRHFRVAIHQRYPLADAARAHIDLEARKTTGATVLLP